MPRPKKDVVDDFVDRYLGFSAQMRKELLAKLQFITKIENRLAAPPAQEPPKRKSAPKPKTEPKTVLNVPLA